MIIKCIKYKQLDGREIIKAWDPKGFYFYLDAADEDILQKYNISIVKAGSKSNMMVPKATSIKENNVYRQKSFGQLLTFKYKGVYKIPGIIADHINGLEIDNIKSNIRLVNLAGNGRNQFSQGYTINFKDSASNGQLNTTYLPTIKIRTSTGHKSLRPFGMLKSEKEAAIYQFFAEQQYINGTLPGVDYTLINKRDIINFDFVSYRRFSPEILDRERTGKISKEQAIYEQLKKFSHNIWYYYRYNLKQLYIDYKIGVPKNWYEDAEGRLRFLTNGELCCPFERGINVNRINK